MDAIKPSRSIKTYVHLSWLISGGIATLLSLLTFLLVGWIEFRNSNLRVQDILLEKSQVAARRLAGELLIGSKGAVDAVSRVLEKELRIDKIELIEEVPPCVVDNIRGEETCFLRGQDSHVAFRRIPYFQDIRYVKLSLPASPFLFRLELGLLFWLVFPILSILVVGIVLQRFCLQRYVLVPIESLVKTTLETSELPRYWPREIQDIAVRLSQTFQDREQAILDQISAGVIHDIKSLLHPLLSATELVKEQSIESPRRPSRLENLFRSCLRNLPKIRDIVQTTMDGTREIQLRVRFTDVCQTIENAMAVNRDFAETRRIELEFLKYRPTMVIEHDPIQLERVFVNLIKNAIEAFENDSCSVKEVTRKTIRIKLGKVRYGLLSVAVEDSGPGISGPIFRPLRTKKYQGVGLGLVVSKKIVEAHGGTISAGKSSDLGGASFLVSIPTTLAKKREVCHESAISLVSG